MIFVFGSNESGIHGAGAALHASLIYGARPQQGFGPQGQSFAIPTKDWDLKPLTLLSIGIHVNSFIRYARREHDEVFMVTQIGCGYAGFKAEQIAPMFVYAPRNCKFDSAWRLYLPNHEYWGTYA